MELPLLDQQFGRDFSAKVRNLFGVPVSHGGSSFYLLVSFSRFRFRLSPESVEHCLVSILGGTSKNFAAFQLEDQIFRFSVSSKQVGFLVLRLESFACDSFKLAFHLFNDSGLIAARVFTKSDSGPPPSPWTEINRKNRMEALMRMWFDPSVHL
jgi:hypothetical protein